MSKSYEIKIPAHPSIYEKKERDINIYFCEPEAGINTQTGILFLIAGFGGNSNSNVYKKMRSLYADKYNMITIQCDYYGYEFMQAPSNTHIDIEAMNKTFNSLGFENSTDLQSILDICSQNNITLKFKEILKETLSYHNDMGIMQAIDNLTALIAILSIIKDNGYSINQNKIVLYGHSHGSYLSYLCNALAPNICTHIIDNSSWLFPTYLKKNRYMTIYSKNPDIISQVEFEYLASKMDYDEELLNLKNLYTKFDNKCSIISFHGTTDNLISDTEKKEFCQMFDNIKFYQISSDKIDGSIFKSTDHGLGADFLKLYDYIVENNLFETKLLNRSFSLENITYETSKYKYIIDYSMDIPILTIE